MTTTDFNYLRHHAMQNVWCTPEQDHQYILQPARVTPAAGVMRSYRVMWHTVPLPDQYSRWHILQVGGIDPIAFNLFFRSFEWISMATVSNERKMIVNIYNNDGIELPRHETYYRYTQTGALIVAIRINNRIPVNFAQDTFSIRVYSNSFWNSPRSAGIARKIDVKGVIAENATARDTFFSQYNTLLAENPAPGVLSFYLNGVKRENLVQAAVQIGDSLEYVWDGSVKAQYKLPIKDIHSFESELDAKRKLLLHYAGPGPTTIDYQDDIDIHISGLGTNPYHVFYHRNAVDAVRQVTHRDYAIPAMYLERYAAKVQQLGPYTGSENMFVTLTLRKSGYDRPLVYEHGRLNELYKMSDEHVIRAMVEIDATVDIWRAATLEKSGYTQIMRSKPCEITAEMTERAYGYFAMAKYLADTPNQLVDVGGAAYCMVPYKLMTGCTAYEYDANGHFLGWHHHYVGDRYYAHDPDARTVELIAGFGGTVLDEVNGKTTAAVQADRNYKVYVRSKVGGVLQPNPTDVTGTDQYKIENGVFTWLSNSTTAYPTLRSDRNFYAADHEVMATDGLITVTLQTQQNHDNVTSWGRLIIPLGQLDVILNGRSLINGLEYFYKNGVVFITAKEWLNNPETDVQKVHIRMAGFCQSDMSIYPEGDVGYILHGVLSNNRRFDLRDGKVQRLVVGGRLLTKADVTFSEDSEQVAITHADNGIPYMLKDLHVPLRPHVARDTYELIATARSLDKQVSDYITPRLPEFNRGPIAAVTDRYMVFSPFFCKLLFDIKYGRLVLPLQNSFTLQEVVNICKAYEYLLEVDPVRRRDIVKTDYVSVQPHSFPNAINLQHHQYQFMNQAVNYYAEGLVTLSPSVTLST